MTRQHGASAGQPDAVRRPDAARRPGDDGDLTC